MRMRVACVLRKNRRPRFSARINGTLFGSEGNRVKGAHGSRPRVLVIDKDRARAG